MWKLVNVLNWVDSVGSMQLDGVKEAWTLYTDGGDIDKVSEDTTLLCQTPSRKHCSCLSHVDTMAGDKVFANRPNIYS